MRYANMKNKVVSAALISANVLTLVTPAVVHAADQPETSSQSSLVQNNKQEHKNKKGETTTDKKEDKTKDSSTAVDLKSEEKKDSNENPQTLKEQTMVLQKVIATSEDDLNSDSLKGVNGAQFTVYDVTDLMNTIIKEKLKVSDSAPTDEAIDKAVDKFNEDGKEAVNTTTDAKEKEATNQSTSDSEKSGSDKQETAKVSDTTKNSNKQAEGKASTQAPKADLDLSDSTKESKDKEQSSETSQSSKSKSSEEKADESKNSVDESSKSSSDTNKNKEDKKSKEEEKLVAEIEQMRKDDTIRKEVASRAAKLDPKEMKTFAQVTTEHDKESNKDGVARVKLPIDGKYHAYYIVNTETPKEALAKNSDPIVLLTPVTDKDGKYSPEFKVYPKSDKITPENPNKPDNPQTPNKENEQKKDNPTPTQAQEGDKPTVTDAKMVQTGKEHGFLKTVMSYLENFFN